MSKKGNSSKQKITFSKPSKQPPVSAESSANIVSQEEQVALDEVFGRKTRRKGGGAPNISFSSNDAGDSFPQANVVSRYICHSLQKGKKSNGEKGALTELKEGIERLSPNDTVVMFKELVAHCDNTNEGNQAKKQEKACLEELLTKYSYIFVEKYMENIGAVYHYVVKLNELIDFSHTPLFNCEPDTAIYGSKVIIKGDITSNATIRQPLDRECILKIIDAQISTNHPYYAGKWIFSVLGFSFETLSRVLGDVAKELKDSRIHLIADIENLLKKDSKYKEALIEYMLSDNGPNIVNLIKNSASLDASKLEMDQAIEKKDAECREIAEQLKTAEETNELLVAKCSDFEQIQAEKDRIEAEHHRLITRIDNQIEINEDIVSAKKAAISEKENIIATLRNEANEMFAELEEVNSKLAELTRERDNLSADLENERIRMAAIRSDRDVSIKKAIEEQAGDFVSVISYQVNHFLKAFSYFLSEGLDEDTLRMCKDDLLEMIGNLKKFGIVSIGAFGSETKFETALHHCEESVQEGERVSVENIGWRVAGKVIVKADVAKVEE